MRLSRAWAAALASAGGAEAAATVEAADDAAAVAAAAVADAAALLTDLGHHVEPCDTPFNGVQLAEDFLLAWFCAQAFIVDHIQRAFDTLDTRKLTVLRE